MSLKENTSYNYGSTMKSIARGVANFNKNLPKSASPVGQYNNLRTTVANSTPATKGNITTQYGGSTKYENFHPGVDIAHGMGTQLPSYTSGKVTEVVSGKKQGDSGFGNYIIVTDNEGNKLRYSHLQNTYVRVGQQINKGQVLGTEGNSGQTYSLSGGTGAHLDLRVKDIYGKYINPYRFIS